MDIFRKVLKKANPNRHGYVKLIQYDEGEDAAYVVVEPDNEDGVEFDGDFAAAERYYEKAVAEWNVTPNWEAQERYDEEHGTINGYAPWQYEDREY